MTRIGVLVESHYDEVEFNLFNEAFTKDGYELEYISYLWGQDSLTFDGNDHGSRVEVTKCVTAADVADYDAIILIGGYAMDRLRYQAEMIKGAPSSAPAVKFLRDAVSAMDNGALKIGTICHALWLFCADNKTLTGRKVTCAHNIICDVENAGGIVEYERPDPFDAGPEDPNALPLTQAKDIVIDGGLISAKHPAIAELFVDTLKRELQKEHDKGLTR